MFSTDLTHFKQARLIISHKIYPLEWFISTGAAPPTPCMHRASKTPNLFKCPSPLGSNFDSEQFSVVGWRKWVRLVQLFFLVFSSPRTWLRRENFGVVLLETAAAWKLWMRKGRRGTFLASRLSSLIFRFSSLVSRLSSLVSSLSSLTFRLSMLVILLSIISRRLSLVVCLYLFLIFFFLHGLIQLTRVRSLFLFEK